MALVVKDRVKETTTTVGTGTYTLAGAVAGFQSFSVIGDGNTTFYAVSNNVDWEVGIGTYTASGTTLARTTILESSNSGNAVDWGVGSKDIFVTYPAERSVYLNAAGSAVDVLDIGTLGTSTANISTANITAGVVTTTPTSSTDLVNKQYVDNLIASGIHYHQPVRVESPINLNATYSNGTDGVGATLTNAGTQAALVIDGVTVNVNDRVLVYQQTTQTQNGIYTVTNVGSGSTNWVLTRATDADSYVFDSPNGLSEGSTVFVQQGATGAGETYTCNTSGTITFGTTNITFVQVSSAQIYSAGTGLTLSGTQFSLSDTGTAGTYGSASQVPVFTTNAQGQVTSVTNTAIAIPASAITSGVLGLANGGTGETTAQLAINTLAGAVTSGQYLRGNGSNVVMSAIQAGDVPTLNQNTTGTAGNVTGVVAVLNGGTGSTTQSGARTGLGATTLGSNLFTITDPNAITFPRFNADNSVSSLNATDFRTAIGAGTGNGSVTSVGGTGTVNGISLTGTVTSSGSLTLGGTLSGVSLSTQVTGILPVVNGGTGQTTTQAAINSLAGAVTSGQYLRGNGTNVVMSAIQASDVPTLNQNTTGTAGNVTGTVAIANGGTGATTNTTARTNLGATTLGSNLFTITNPSAVTFPRFNADNTVSSLNATDFRTAIGAGTGNGTVTSVGGTGSVNGITLSGTVTSSGSLTLGGTLSGVSLSTQVTGTLPVANGGTGLTTIAALSIPVANSANTYTTVTPAAGQSVRINAGGTAWEAYTPSAGGSGTVTSVAFSTGTTGLSVTGSPITTSGTITLAGTLAIANGGTGATTNTTARTNLGATTVGSNFFTLTNPSAVTFPRINADNTVSTLDAATFRTAIGAGTGSGTVTSVSGTGSASGLSLSGTVTTSGSITLSGTVNSLAAGTYGINITGNANTATTATSATSASSATTATTATNWGSYGAVPVAGTSFGNANTIGRSDGNGYAYFNYINSNTVASENPAIDQVITTNASDNFYRKASISHFTSAVQSNASGNWSINAATATSTTTLKSGSNEIIATSTVTNVVPNLTLYQNEGQIVTYRLAGNLSYRTATPATAYWFDYNQSNTLTSADSLDTTRMFAPTSAANSVFGANKFAIMSGFGSASVRAGLAFGTGTANEVLAAGAGSTPTSYSNATDHIMLGFNEGPKLVVSRRWAGSPTDASTTVLDVVGTNAILYLTGGIAVNSFTTVTATTATISRGNTFVIFNVAGTCTVTFNLASNVTPPGSLFFFKTVTANSVVSAASNVVPLNGTVAGTAILSGGAGKWALLHHNGTTLTIMAAN